MMKHLFLLAMLLMSSISVFSKTWTIVNSNFTFSPNALTIQEGDSVLFQLASVHNAREVAEATWNANGSTALSGGFQLNFSGGLLLPAQLTVGTHFYVCVPHASMGMKGKIIVEGASGTDDHTFPGSLRMAPNPSTGVFQLSLTGNIAANNCNLSIYNLQGSLLYAQSNINLEFATEINMAQVPKGVYLAVIKSEAVLIQRKIVIE